MSMCGMVSELMVGGRRGRRPNSRAGGMSKFEKKRWSKEEDRRLLNHLKRYGVKTKWDKVPRLCGLYPRSGKSCRSRWLDYLRPDLKKVPLTEEEGLRVIQLQQILGNKWARIAKSGWCNDPNPPIPLSCSSTSVFGDSIPSTGGSPLYDEYNHDISLLSQDYNAAILYSPDHLMLDQMFDHNNSGWPAQDVDESLEDHTTTNESG
ncbi:Myb-related protein Hv33 [Acorus calamus]|uniref:Myb-related protein Hv33 n=1 Tax=Acorus calamus TaxID=4465 RepID=A0AAV9EZY9_ACOCL|nr:Myb-related protein Hv33 [Acorus calamus]